MRMTAFEILVLFYLNVAVNCISLYLIGKFLTRKKLIEPFKKVNRKTIQEIHEDKNKKKTAIKLKNNKNC